MRVHNLPTHVVTASSQLLCEGLPQNSSAKDKASLSTLELPVQL